MSQLKVDTITDEAGTGAPDFTSGLKVGGTSYPSVGPLSNRNKIINGAMVIDQRNAGAAVNTSASGIYFGVDRTLFFKNSSANFTIQQSSVAPQGFSRSLSATVTTAATAGAAEENVFQDNVEGFNTADLNFGSVNASAVTLSFWVRSSLVGTYCVAFRNAAFNRSYVDEYTINAADTWEYKTISLAGDTAGTWEVGNSTGIRVLWDLGSGSNGNAVAGSWTASGAIKTANQVNWANTSGATWQITGVQLEAGDTATPFEHRSFGQELALCQRYYEFGEATYLGSVIANRYVHVKFTVSKRAAPTVTRIGDGPITTGTSGTTVFGPTDHGFYWFQTGTNAIGGNYTASAEL